MKPTISVIVAIYNAEKYLRKCIQSICDQTYQNLEIILVDDGSKDCSLDICHEFGELDSRIVIVHKENGGVAAARNSGLDAAHGEYIAFVDADDYLAPQMYERLLESITATDADMVLCNFVGVDENGEKTVEFSESGKYIIAGTYTGDEVMERLLYRGGDYYTVVWNRLYKRKIFDTVRFLPGRIHDDVMIAHRIIGECKKVTCIDDVLYYYVMNSASFIHGKVNIRHYDKVLAYLDRAQYLIDRGHSKDGAYCLAGAALRTGKLHHSLERTQEERQKYRSMVETIRNVWQSIDIDCGRKLNFEKMLFRLSPDGYYHIHQLWYRVNKRKK